jgi:parallel beta-helix repeat protein
MGKNVVGSFKVLGLLSVLFLSVLAFRVQAIIAGSGTIYIRADGSIDPRTAPISTVDNITYTLIGNITSIADGIVIQRDNVILDGAGCTLQGTNKWNYFMGVSFSGRTNVTIENMTVTEFYDGIAVDHSSDCHVLNNNVTDNVVGFSLASTNPSQVNPSVHNTISGNKAVANLFGIFLDRSGTNILTNNVMTNNEYNFGINAENIQQFMNHVDPSNTVDHKPVCFWVHARNASVPTDAGYVALIDCTNITVGGLELKSNYQGVLLAQTNNSRILGDSIKNNYNGVDLRWSFNNTVVGNNMTGNAVGAGLIWFSSNNAVSGNSITNSGEGVFMFSNASDNAVFGNTIANSLYEGIVIETYSYNNKIFHNNFLNNTKQVIISNFKSSWDDGYPSGGNYWSDYEGSDLYSGPYQNETGYDWIGDTPYVIDQNNTDRYPLMHPFESESQEMEVAYRNLLGDYNRLLMNFNALNASYQYQLLEYSSLQLNYTTLQKNFTELLTCFNALNASYQQHLLNYATLETNYTKLREDFTSLNTSYITLNKNYQALNSSYNNLNANFSAYKTSTQNDLTYAKDLVYVLTATTVILIVAIVYVLLRKPQTKPKTR